MKTTTIDMLTGIALALISVAVFIGAGQYAGRGVNTYGPNFFPQMLAALLFVCSLWLAVQGARGVMQGQFESIDRGGFKTLGVTVLFALLYLGGMQVVGFLAATIAFLYVMMWFLGVRRQASLLGASLGVAGAINAIFYFFLKIPLPEGLL